MIQQRVFLLPIAHKERESIRRTGNLTTASTTPFDSFELDDFSVEFESLEQKLKDKRKNFNTKRETSDLFSTRTRDIYNLIIGIIDKCQVLRKNTKFQNAQSN